jgi:hypothetical protein
MTQGNETGAAGTPGRVRASDAEREHAVQQLPRPCLPTCRVRGSVPGGRTRGWEAGRPALGLAGVAGRRGYGRGSAAAPGPGAGDHSCRSCRC